MARPIWKGMISFGLVSVPVSLYPAEQSHQLAFSMLDQRDFSPVGYKRYNKTTGKEVPWKDIVKGYEYEKDEYVVLSDEDFRRANVQQAKSVDIATFVDAGAIPRLDDGATHRVRVVIGERVMVRSGRRTDRVV